MLKGERVKLAPLKREYIEKFLEWLNDPEIIQYLIRYRPLTRDMEEEWFDNLKTKENTIIFSILLTENKGNENLEFLCIVDPAWQPEIETIIENGK